MMKSTFAWTLSHTPNLSIQPKDMIPATVPGAVQLDYAKALNYAPYTYGMNFKQFDWMEDEYFIYETVLDFTCRDDEHAEVYFGGIDYRYEIYIDEVCCVSGEGMFTPVRLDVTAYRGKKTALKVVIAPIPKYPGAPRNRDQAKACCKPASSYGWDWHPRLVPSGIWGEAELRIAPIGSPETMEVAYRLSDALDRVTVEATVKTYGQSELIANLLSPAGEVVATTTLQTDADGMGELTLTLDRPQLWYPRGYGEQPIYTLQLEGNGALERRIGFRRSKLLENKGAKIYEKNFPKGPLPAPMTLEINGRRIFAKGSNWVNTEIFPCLMTPSRYDELLDLVCRANMNILRMWGGQFINHEYFYERCDELGILIWQEFMLSCNRHPDEDHYLSVLEQEATTIIRRLRTHPCLAFWCGGNELFNSWSGLTLQSHPLRLLDSLCYQHDRFTPFNMTSPLHGVAHGSYVKVMFSDEDRKTRTYAHGEEFICALKQSRNTAYTEFGCNGASPKAYILQYIMDESDYADCNEQNEVWVAHHAFKAWMEYAWLGIPEVEYFFGSYADVDDLIEKSIYLQDLCYKSMFEEMRRQAPLCSMAINWDFNEPWPCAAGNSLVNWPAEPKSCLTAVAEALRPTILSLETERNRYLNEDTFSGRVWMLNDSDEPQSACTVDVYLLADGMKKRLDTIAVPAADARANAAGGTFAFAVTPDLPERFAIELSCGDQTVSSTYHFVHNCVAVQAKDAHAEVSDDFSDFLR